MTEVAYAECFRYRLIHQHDDEPWEEYLETGEWMSHRDDAIRLGRQALVGHGKSVGMMIDARTFVVPL